MVQLELPHVNVLTKVDLLSDKVRLPAGSWLAAECHFGLVCVLLAQDGIPVLLQQPGSCSCVFAADSA